MILLKDRYNRSQTSGVLNKRNWRFQAGFRCFYDNIKDISLGADQEFNSWNSAKSLLWNLWSTPALLNTPLEPLFVTVQAFKVMDPSNPQSRWKLGSGTWWAVKSCNLKHLRTTTGPLFHSVFLICKIEITIGQVEAISIMLGAEKCLVPVHRKWFCYCSLRTGKMSDKKIGMIRAHCSRGQDNQTSIIKGLLPVI